MSSALLTGLEVDEQKVKTLLSSQSLETAARTLGNDVSSYDNLFLAGRLLLESMKDSFPSCVEEYVEVYSDFLQEEVALFLLQNKKLFNALLEENSSINLNFDWIGANVLSKTYLVKVQYKGRKYRESPALFYLRVAAFLYYPDVNEVVATFVELVAQRYFHATPTNLNAGKKNPQCSSCFLLSIEDSLDSITELGVHKAAQIQKNAGGLGIDVSRIRHSKIKNAKNSQGLAPMLYLYNAAVRYVNQGGKRKGAATVSTRSHHIDILDFIELNQLTGDPYTRCLSLDLSLWTSWLFWKRVKENSEWTLFCPALTKSLNDIYGIEFIEEYERLEKDLSIPRKTIPARKLFEYICKNQQTGGKLYTMNGDGANFKSNQKNLGYIRCPNLCQEIIQYSSEKEISACNLAQISLPAIVEKEEINYSLLGSITSKLVRNLNRIIERSWYPFPEIKNSNDRNRPMGIGVSGFAEMLHKLDLPFQDLRVREINKKIFACIYFNALVASLEESIKKGPYETFSTSPTAEGKLQFDLWAEEFHLLQKHNLPCSRKKEEDLPLHPQEWGQRKLVLSNGIEISTWEELKEAIKKFGLRNSLLIAIMPTATSSVVMRNCESVEAHQSNLYDRKLQSGNFPLLNRFMYQDLKNLGLWNRETVQLIQADEGSIARLEEFLKTYPQFFPDFTGDWSRLKLVTDKYKTMWELPQSLFIKLAAERARYICQSQSTNLYFKYPTLSQLYKAQIFSLEAGLKTLVYYIRQQAASNPLKITIPNHILKFIQKRECNEEVCLSCQ